ncbi:hypothetical protein FIBSPDRAFT_1053287 [Athelia psychrophila]|uniref:Terpenoid synthase n=1 Tax=Athelia psychrophila TaxID=1759441 RepID=A0A167X6N8_9AGAM|nr:hypothetical protein FIBSPDRAFT_1053287 [Fibularhizoctonia sp. CBS 109695]
MHHALPQHPAMVSLNNDITDMTTLVNDMYSYRKEVLGGDADYNVVTVVMYIQKTDLAGALQWISDTHDELIDRFLNTRQNVLDMRGVPSWGKDTDRQVAAYVDGLASLTCAGVIFFELDGFFAISRNHRILLYLTMYTNIPLLALLVFFSSLLIQS